MSADQITMFAILGATLAMFIIGKVRYDLVALLSLLALVFTQIIPPLDAFSGFGNPAVITVAAVLLC